MTSKIDKSRCARLVVEAALLIQSIRNKYGAFGKTSNGSRRVYRKSSHKFCRRAHALDTIIAEDADEEQEMYVGRCTKNTPPKYQRSLITPGRNIVYFDISEFTKH